MNDAQLNAIKIDAIDQDAILRCAITLTNDDDSRLVCCYLRREMNPGLKPFAFDNAGNKTTNYSTWLTDAREKPGEIAVFEQNGNSITATTRERLLNLFDNEKIALLAELAEADVGW